MRTLRSLIFAGLAVLAACTDDNSSIYISHVSIFEFEEGQGCTAAVDAAIGRAQLNVAYPNNSYIMPAVVASQLVRRDIATSAEPNGVNITSAEIRLLNQAGQELAPAYSVVPSSGGYIPPSSVGDESRAIVTLPIIPGPAIELLQGLVRAEGEQTLVVEMRVIGRTTGGTEVESALFNYGIELVDRPDFYVCYSPAVLEEMGVLTCTSGQDGLPYLDYDCSP